MEYTPDDIAVALELSAEMVRRHMRKQGIRVGKGRRHVLDKKAYERLLRELRAIHTSDPSAWALDEAKSCLRTVVTLALTKGPQRVRLRHQSVVILAESEFRRLTASRPSFKQDLLGSPRSRASIWRATQTCERPRFCAAGPPHGRGVGGQARRFGVN